MVQCFAVHLTAGQGVRARVCEVSKYVLRAGDGDVCNFVPSSGTGSSGWMDRHTAWKGRRFFFVSCVPAVATFGKVSSQQRALPLFSVDCQQQSSGTWFMENGFTSFVESCAATAMHRFCVKEMLIIEFCENPGTNTMYCSFHKRGNEAHISKLW